MTYLANALRSEFQIPSLCQILIGTVLPYWEQGVHRHFIHHTTGPAKFNLDGSLAPDSYGTLAVETQFARQTGISRFLEDEKGTTPYRAPFETLTVSMPLDGLGAVHRTQILMEVTDLLQELMFWGTPVPMVTVSREVKIGKNTVIRHHLVAILDAFQRPFWVHPGMATFGLGEMPFPPEQLHQDMGSIARWVDYRDSERFVQDPWGYPRWYPTAVALEGRPPVHEDEKFRVGPLELPVPTIVRAASHQMLNCFETYFGAGTLIPARCQGWRK